jgi:hypothetical protein
MDLLLEHASPTLFENASGGQHGSYQVASPTAQREMQMIQAEAAINALSSERQR